MSSRKPYSQYTANDWLNDPDFDVTPPRDEPSKAANVQEPAQTSGDDLGVIDAGEDWDVMPPPRAWLLGNVFARKFLSIIFAAGATGKTTLRYAQYLSMCTGRELTGEHVFAQCKVLIICLEDDLDELRRRIRAARLHYKISREEVNGRLFYCAPLGRAGKLLSQGKDGLRPGGLREQIEREIVRHKVDLVALDPFIKAHGVGENDNNAIDAVVNILTDLGAKYDIAVDTSHHVSKGQAEPGSSDKGRGASSMRDGGRLVYTLTTMTAEEAKNFGIPEEDRALYFRVDRGKVNLTPARKTKWFKLVGVPLGNANGAYPDGDEVATVEPWMPPDAWADLNNGLLNRILDEIDIGLTDGTPYSGARQAGEQRGAWAAVIKHASGKTPQQAKEIIATWIKNGVLVETEYTDKWSKPGKGVKSDPGKRPTI